MDTYSKVLHTHPPSIYTSARADSPPHSGPAEFLPPAAGMQLPVCMDCFQVADTECGAAAHLLVPTCAAAAALRMHVPPHTCDQALARVQNEYQLKIEKDSAPASTAVELLTVE